MMGDLKEDHTDLEIDFEYEFDAAKYFDFCREETSSEAWEAQRWFEICGNYPPSPFMSKLNVGGEFHHENVNTLPKIKDAIHDDTADSNMGSGPEFSAYTESGTNKVYTVQFSMNVDASKEDKKFMKGPFSKGSTLMKPTLSYMAKQNRIRDARRTEILHRSTKLSTQKHIKVIKDSVENAGHASKRQKLEGGNLWKVAGTNDHTNLSHKAPQKQKTLVADAVFHQSRLRVTIPRQPELETAQRAQRQRIQSSRSNTANQSEEGKTSSISKFKARPLNRKIFEASTLPPIQKCTPQQPQFQPFNLKTDERALLHSAANSLPGALKNPFSVSTAQGSGPFIRNLKPLSGTSKPQNVEPKKDESDSAQIKFKAQPLNKKILSSKGDIGVFRSAKKETTKPMEFNFSTSKRHQQDPPTELFNKLSLNMDTQETTPGSVFQCRANGVNKIWKENLNCNVPNESTRIFW